MLKIQAKATAHKVNTMNWVLALKRQHKSGNGPALRSLVVDELNYN